VDASRRGRSYAARLADKSDRTGFALLAALLALLLIAALIAGVFGATTEETRIGSSASARQVALLGAESAIEGAITALSMAPDDSIGVGETRSSPVDGLGLPVVVHVTRLDSSLYWLVAQAGDTASSFGISRRIGVVVRLINLPGHSITIDRIQERAWSELF
jgi:type II secretory pathway pseudopilin PulG